MAHFIIRGVSSDQIRAIKELHALRAENGRLKDELKKLRKAMQSTQQASSSSQMSSRLRDALRE
jgi:hypothetical protein